MKKYGTIILLTLITSLYALSMTFAHTKEERDEPDIIVYAQKQEDYVEEKEELTGKLVMCGDNGENADYQPSQEELQIIAEKDYLVKKIIQSLFRSRSASYKRFRITVHEGASSYYCGHKRVKREGI